MDTTPDAPTPTIPDVKVGLVVESPPLPVVSGPASAKTEKNKGPNQHPETASLCGSHARLCKHPKKPAGLKSGGGKAAESPYRKAPAAPRGLAKAVVELAAAIAAGPPLLVDAQGAAVLLRVSVRTFHATRDLPGFPRQVTLTGGVARWSRADLEAWVAKRPRRNVCKRGGRTKGDTAA